MGKKIIVIGRAMLQGSQQQPSRFLQTNTSTANAPAARGGHTAVWTGSEMIVWGRSVSVGDVGRYFRTRLELNKFCGPVCKTVWLDRSV